MFEIAEAFRTGGIWMYLILAESLLAMMMLAGCSILFVASFTRPSKRRRWRLMSGGALLATVLLVLGTGALGWYVGMQEMEDALLVATPENVEEMRQVGSRLALYPLQFAGLVAALPGVGGVVFFLTGLFTKSSAPLDE